MTRKLKDSDLLFSLQARNDMDPISDPVAEAETAENTENAGTHPHILAIPLHLHQVHLLEVHLLLPLHPLLKATGKEKIRKKKRKKIRRKKKKRRKKRRKKKKKKRKKKRIMIRTSD